MVGQVDSKGYDNGGNQEDRLGPVDFLARLHFRLFLRCWPSRRTPRKRVYGGAEAEVLDRL